MIVTMCDISHKKWLMYNLRSIAATNPKEKILAYLINFKKQDIKEIKKINRLATIKNTTCDVYKCPHGKISQYKPIAINYAINNFDEDILWIDADCIILGSLQRLYKMLKSYQFIILCRDFFGKEPATINTRFNAGVFALRKDASTKEFVKYWNDLCNRDLNDPKKWCEKQHDQGRLFLSYHKFRDKIKMTNLPLVYNMMKHDLRSSTIIWHIKTLKLINEKKCHMIIKKLLSNIEKKK